MLHPIHTASRILLLACLAAAPAAAHSPEEIRAYLLENPELAIEVLETLNRQQQEQQERQKAATAEWIRAHPDEVYDDGYSVVAGNPDGDLTLVEFYDYRCGYCRRAFHEIRAFLEADGNIRYVLKEFPILSPASETAARAAIAASEQDRGEQYLAFHRDLLFHKGPLDEEALLALADAHKFDPTQLLQDMDSDRIRERIARNYATARELGIRGTPAFILGDDVQPGYLDRQDLADWAAHIRNGLN